MKKILVMLMLVLLGCGDSSNVTGGISITCMDVDSSVIEVCDGEAARTVSAVDIPSVAFDSGNVQKLTALMGVMEVENNSGSTFKGVYVAPLYIEGCGNLGYLIGNTEIPTATRATLQYGGSSCEGAVLGPNRYEVKLYEGVFDLSTFAPGWTDWDWNKVDADMASVGLVPFMKGTVIYEYVQ